MSSYTLRTAAMVLCMLGLGPWAARAEPGASAGAAVRTVGLPQPGRHSIMPEQLRRAVQRYLERELEGKVREVQVTLIEPQEPIATPSPRVNLEVIPGVQEEGLGRRLFRVRLSHRGRELETVEVLSDVAGYADVVVPSRLILTDEIINAEDLTLSRVKLIDLKQPFMTNPNDAIGKSAARPLQSQVPIRLASLKKPYAVRKGDRVTIEARSGGLFIQATGVTKSGGELGQSVTVVNSDSGKELRAKVVAPGVVHVEF
ncbi:MAG TPA: flagellar basal body P-ring formation chaperone FlgA [Nitrospira sp.]|nr:flagellar basal body P-ring formation chaperone FlgA [Nitrospira sp.]